MSQKLKLAILDMNRQTPNQGMRCIREHVAAFSEWLEVEEFEVRVANQLPDLSFDIYISSGGPGSPWDGNGVWEKQYYQLLDQLWQHNLDHREDKKHCFFICHSFQLACIHFELGEITKRRATSFGIYPVHKTHFGKVDPVLAPLPDPYHVVDSRDWQLIQPREEVLADYGAEILSIERVRDHPDAERAVMAVRFSQEFVGTQYHPEADAAGMKIHFQKEENRQKVINRFGAKFYQNMMAQLDDPDKIHLTHTTIIPTFLRGAIEALTGEPVS
jgi:homoserine O-succinyltransferase